MYVISVVNDRPPNDLLLVEVDAAGAFLGFYKLAGARGCNPYAPESITVEVFGRDLDIVHSCASMRQSTAGSGQPCSTPAAEAIRVRVPALAR